MQLVIGHSTYTGSGHSHSGGCGDMTGITRYHNTSFGFILNGPIILFEKILHSSGFFYVSGVPEDIYCYSLESSFSSD